MSAQKLYTAALAAALTLLLGTSHYLDCAPGAPQTNTKELT